MRFAFGAAISLVAGIIGLAVNSTFGGMFLAFPAILPATITLLEKREGRTQALHDTQGAILGALGLLAFALVAEFGLRRAGGVFSLLAALAAWAAVSLVLYLAAERIVRAGPERASRIEPKTDPRPRQGW